MKVDLHIHTNYSDGAYDPSTVVQKSAKAGLNIISITDHDNVDGIKEAIECGKDLNVEVIPGLEISTDLEDNEIHLLAYFIDVTNEELQKYLKFFREERFYRAKRIVKKLQNLGLNITIDHVMEKAKNSAVGRPHIAYALVDLGLVNDYYEAFHKYIGDYAPAYEKKIHVSPVSALKLISDAGGLSFIAHPGNIKDSILYYLIKSGIDGIETIHPSHSETQIRFFKGIVSQYCLLSSGGSDYHGGKKDDEGNLGKYYITESQLDAMRKMLIKNNS
ncbi:PHP domain-containing protein [Melioribacteraceae bacterium 4301-Me]|uniref:PHP domain-containing protein n=1 Tax=Pyranulibacter aquaticus TaxID=3163344 RepID=UPI00359945E2